MLHHLTPVEEETERNVPSRTLVSAEAPAEIHLEAPITTVGAVHASASLSAVSEAPRDAHIEDFLDRVFARLVAVLPYEERLARRDAMRAQIEQSIAAHIELGCARHEAIALTLAQIQREQAVASQAVQQHVQTPAAKRQYSDRPATITALGIFGLFYLLDQTRAAWYLWLKSGGQYTSSFYRFELLVLPIICGLAVGLLAKHRPARGTLNALMLLAIPAIAWGGFGWGLSYAGLLPNDAPEWLKFIFPNPIPAVCGIGAWAVLGGLSAGAGGWLRGKLPRAKNAARAMGRRGRRLLRKPKWAVRRNKNIGSPSESPD